MTSGAVRRAAAHRRRHLRRPAARRTWRRSTASTRARCSGSPRAWRPASSEVSLGPDGAIYVGGLGAGGNWGQDGKLTYGLQKLTPNGSNTFDMLPMRAVAGRLRDRIHPAAVGRDRRPTWPRKYRVKQWRYVPTAAYGGPKVDEETLTGHLGDAVRRRQEGHAGHRRAASPAGSCTCARPRPFASATGAVAVEHRGLVHAQHAAPARRAARPAHRLYEPRTARLSGAAGIDTEHTGYTGSGFVAGYRHGRRRHRRSRSTSPRPATYDARAAATPTAPTRSRAPRREPLRRRRAHRALAAVDGRVEDLGQHRADGSSSRRASPRCAW